MLCHSIALTLKAWHVERTFQIFQRHRGEDLQEVVTHSHASLSITAATHCSSNLCARLKRRGLWLARL